MNVAILYSGGKDSTFALQHAKQKGWNVQYLLSVKPTRKDCFLFHYATVEQTKHIAEMLEIPHHLLSCSVADPKQEADIVKQFVEKQQQTTKIDAMILGGTGLQETQIKSIQEALMPMGIEVFAAHAGEEHDLVVDEMLNAGYEIMITQVAGEGLMQWLGKTITKDNFQEIKADSIKYGFHVGGEGGYYDTLIVNAPFFTKRLEVTEFDIVKNDECCGHIVIKQARLIEKEETVAQTVQ